MAPYRQLKTNFVSGEFDPLLFGRPDIKYYYNGAKYLRNVLVRPQGGVTTRPGTRWIDTVDDIPAPDGGGVSLTRMMAFQFSTEQTYLFVFSHKKVTIYRDGSEVASLTTPWESGDLRATYTAGGDLIQAGLNWAQSKDTLVVFHEDYPTKIIQRAGSHTSWTIGDYNFRNIPIFDFGDTDYSAVFSATGSLPLGGSGATNLVDGNVNTKATITTVGNLSAAALADRVVAYIDLGSSKEVGHTLISNAKQSANSSDVKIVHSTDAATWTELPEVYALTTSDRDYGISQAYTARYVGLALEQKDYTTDDPVTIGEIECRAGESGVDEEQEVYFPNPGGTADWVSGDTFTLFVEDEETDNIQYHTTDTVLSARIETALAALPNVAAGGISVSNVGVKRFAVKFSGDNGSRTWGAIDYEIKSSQNLPSIQVTVSIKGSAAGEPVWSLSRGYPRCGVFFQGRLWVAGTPSLPNTVWSSRSGDPFDFNNTRLSDDYGITATTDTDDVPAFVNMYAGRHLQLMSTAGEFYVPVSESDAVTPANIVLRRTTSRGSKAGLRVKEVDGGTIFVQRRGNALREFLFADVEQAYQANNISLFASHLVRDPVGLDLRRSSSTEDADYLFVPNSDGTMLVFCTLRNQEVNASMLWQTNGYYQDVAVVLDTVYFAVKRTINGTERIFIEEMDENVPVDCALQATGLGAPASSATLAHLPSTECEYLLDGIPQDLATTDGSGVLTFSRDAASSWIAGLRWPEVLASEYPGLLWAVVTLPVEVQLQNGSSFGKKRRVVDIALRMIDTNGLLVNGNRVTTRSFGSSLLDLPAPEFSGVKRIRGVLGYDYDGLVSIGGDAAGKATISELSYGVSL